MQHWKEDWNFRYSRGIARFIGPTSPYFLRSGHLEKFLFWTIRALTSGMQDVISMAFFVSTATVQRYCWWTNFIKFLRPVDSAQTLLYICIVWRSQVVQNWICVHQPSLYTCFHRFQCVFRCCFTRGFFPKRCWLHCGLIPECQDELLKRIIGVDGGRVETTTNNIKLHLWYSVILQTIRWLDDLRQFLAFSFRSEIDRSEHQRCHETIGEWQTWFLRVPMCELQPDLCGGLVVRTLGPKWAQRWNKATLRRGDLYDSKTQKFWRTWEPWFLLRCFPEVQWMIPMI